MYRLVYDELHDQFWLDHREAHTARPFLFLAVCMWRLGEWDRTASAATLAVEAYQSKGVETTDSDALKVAQGLHALGMFYWGIDLDKDLQAAEALGDSWDEVLGGQFSVLILQALARLEELRGNHFQAQRLTSRANSLMWSSPAAKLPPPAWQVRIAPGGPYAISGVPESTMH